MNLQPESLHAARAELCEWATRVSIPDASLRRVEAMLTTLAVSGQDWKRRDQKPAFYMPELRAQPWWPAQDFAWTSLLEGNADKIIEECRRIGRGPRLRDHPEAALVRKGKWEILPLFTYGRRNEENCSLVPETVAFIEQIPTATEASLVYLSSLAPNTTVRAHFGPTNCRLRCHFGVSIPADCEIRVGSEKRTWREGRCIVFDDSFEHEVANGSASRREVLIIDFWHPELAGDERRLLQRVTDWLWRRQLLAER